MKPKRNTTNIFVVVLIVVLLAAVALLIYEPRVETPPVVLPSAPPGGGALTDPDNVDAVLAEVSPDTVQSLISTLDRASGYSRSVTVEDFWSGGSSSMQLSVWVSGENTLVRADKDGDVQNILLDGETLFIWYDKAGGLFQGLVGSDAEADRWLRCLTYEDLLRVPVDDILSAGYQEYAGLPCVYVEWQGGSFGYRHTAYIAVVSGLLMGSETYDGEQLIYRMSSTAPELNAPDESRFAIPAAPLS